MTPGIHFRYRAQTRKVVSGNRDGKKQERPGELVGGVM